MLIICFVLQKYKSGEMMTGELKARCIEVLQKFIGEFQQVCKHEIIVIYFKFL